jgi:hypothetical protein
MRTNAGPRECNKYWMTAVVGTIPPAGDWFGVRCPSGLDWAMQTCSAGSGAIALNSRWLG